MKHTAEIKMIFII